MRTALLASLLLATGCGPKSDVIVKYGRENNSGTYMFFKEHVLANGDFAAEVQTLPGTAAVINAVAKDTRSLGYGGIGYLKGVRAVPVKKDAASPAIDPTLENVVSGAYPISRYLFFYLAGAPTPHLKHFVDWARGPEGQKVCADAGFYPLPEKDRNADPGPAPAGKASITIKGSDTMVILGGRWVETYTKKFPDVNIQITGGGSGTGIKALMDGETHICLSSRPMKPKEREDVKAKQAKDVVEFSVALDGIAVFVNEKVTLKEITLDQLKGIYTGKIKGWKDLGITLP